MDLESKMPTWIHSFDPILDNSSVLYLILVIVFTLLVLVAKHIKSDVMSKFLAILSERKSPFQPFVHVGNNSASHTADAANVVVGSEKDFHNQAKLFHLPEQPQELSPDEDEHQSLRDLDVDANFATLPEQVNFLANKTTTVNEEKPVSQNESIEWIQEHGFLPSRDPATVTKPQPSANLSLVTLVHSVGIG